MRPEESDTPLTIEKQTEFPSGVGSLLKFSNRTRPDLENPVRELAECMYRESQPALKEMYCCIN
jgi:hypothetical protein